MDNAKSPCLRRNEAEVEFDFAGKQSVQLWVFEHTGTVLTSEQHMNKANLIEEHLQERCSCMHIRTGRIFFCCCSKLLRTHIATVRCVCS